MLWKWILLTLVIEVLFNLMELPQHTTVIFIKFCNVWNVKHIADGKKYLIKTGFSIRVGFFELLEHCEWKKKWKIYNMFHSEQIPRYDRHHLWLVYSSMKKEDCNRCDFAEKWNQSEKYKKPKKNDPLCFDCSLH